MRLCPSVEGSASPLITHRIGVDVCFLRQRTFFHKCHRCIYRGQAANWEPEVSPMAMIDVHAAEEPTKADVPAIGLRGKAKAAGGKAGGRRKAAGPEKAAEAG
ncbi:MAG: hypothetical protein Q7T30_01395 [Planctomycetota bacterium]|nr:hypothetical protein [Planctomycetota bacterium]